MISTFKVVISYYSLSIIDYSLIVYNSFKRIQVGKYQRKIKYLLKFIPTLTHSKFNIVHFGNVTEH